MEHLEARRSRGNTIFDEHRLINSLASLIESFQTIPNSQLSTEWY